MEDNQKKLDILTRKTKIIINELIVYSKSLMNNNTYKESVNHVHFYSRKSLKALNNIEVNFENMREYLDKYYYRLLNIMNPLIIKMVLFSGNTFFSMENWQKKNVSTLFFANYIIYNQNYRNLKNFINEYFIKSYKSSYELRIDSKSPLWDISDMTFFDVQTDMKKIRNISKKIIDNVPLENKHFSMVILEEQISEIIKNAMRHGNKELKEKKVKIWFYTDKKLFKLIVEDEGNGFTNFDQWNEFNRKRNEALKKNNMDEMLKYIQYKGPNSKEEDGGNALFAALEYWDSGMIYNINKNKVVVVKYLY